MSPRLTLGLLGCWVASSWGMAASTAPAPEEKPVLKCELVVTGKVKDVPDPDAGEFVVTNASDHEVDIGTTLGPAGFYDMKIKGPDGKELKTKPRWTYRSPASSAKPYVLKPGESYSEPTFLIGDALTDTSPPGMYKVRAVVPVGGKTYESADVKVIWPFPKK